MITAGKNGRSRCITGLLAILASILQNSTAAPSVARPDWSSSQIEQLRKGPGSANHPVHVVPSGAIRIPEGWPLNGDGTIGCITCHEQMPSEGASDVHLRKRGDLTLQGEQFCAACHSESDGRKASTAHWRAMTSAHVKGDSGSSRFTSRGGGQLDSESTRCLECHDGVSAAEPAITTVFSSTSGGFGDLQRNHRIGMPYSDRPGRGSGAPLRPIGLLPKSIRLPEGKVSCVSCHNLYGSERYHLSAPIEGSTLCFTCHNMD